MTFDDLKFEKRPFGGIMATHVFDNGVKLSVVAGEIAYSNPREDFDTPEEYQSFEVAIMDSSGEFITKDFFPEEYDDVVGWQDIDEINEIIQIVEKGKLT